MVTPLRKSILDGTLRMTGPTREIRYQHPALSILKIKWTFHHYDRHNRWRRKYIMSFNVEYRTFTVVGFRRRSKRAPRAVKVSDGMVVYLRSCLPPADIARCTALAITYEVPDPDDIPF